MKIAIDVDGVLAEQISPALEAIDSDHHMTKSDIQRWDQPIPEAETNIKEVIEKNLQDMEFVLSMSAISGAIEGMKDLQRLGHSLYIITDRPSSARLATKEWIIQQGIPFDKITHTNGKSKAESDARVLIDDYPKNIDEFAGKSRYGLLFSQPWNESYQLTGRNQYRVRDWTEVVSKINSLETTVGNQL